MSRLPRRSEVRPATLAWCALAAALLSCSDTGTGGNPPGAATLDSTRLCALVPARDPAAAAFPPTPPVEVFGTDLGWTYAAAGGHVPILFGDSWQRIDICPLQVNDDSIGELVLPSSDWPGYTARESIPDAQCPEVVFAVDAAGTAFAPITLTRWDGVPVPMGPLNTPIGGFYDGEREWGLFIVGGGQPCTEADAARGAACSTEVSPQAADLRCGLAGGLPRCVDPTSNRTGDGAEAFYVHIGERVGPSAYVSRAVFLTNKYLNLAAKTVRAFDPLDPSGNDYRVGTGALLLWGRPGFDDLAGDGDLLPYFMFHRLPFAIGADGRIAFEPRYLTRVDASGRPSFGSSQTEATPLYGAELEPVNQVAVSWIPALSRWLMFYGGASVDLSDPGRKTGRGQPVEGAMYARIARDPWGPWSAPEVLFANEQAAQDIVCGHQAPPGCLAPPNPPIRPACIEGVDPRGGGAMYGANIIDPMTRDASQGGRPLADVFWNYSTWHPYTVVLARTRVGLE